VQATLTPERLRQYLRSCIQSARERSDEIFGLLQPRALFERPIAERHRLVFYLGHLEAFEWNLICDRAFGMKSASPELDRLFAFGIDPTNGNLPQDSPSDWPADSVIRNYNRNVRSAVDRCLEHATEDRTFWMAVEHRLMHVETLAYLVHGLPHSMKRVNAGPVTTAMEEPVASRVIIPAGIATLGMERTSATFGWDNEYDAHDVHVPSFEMDVYNVTNSQYLEFVRAGAYDERTFWSASAWEWLKTSGIRHPKFWVPNGNDWRTRSMFADIPFQATWPVYVSHAEAEAYCRWKGHTLPSEAQYHRAAFGTPGGSHLPYPWGRERPQRQHGNFDFQDWDSSPVNAHPAGKSAFGISDLMGNGWEWTSTPFAPFAGFEPDPSYPGYSRDFFDGQHYVLKGASPRTSALLLRRSFRNWFQPRYPHIYASFRCVQN